MEQLLVGTIVSVLIFLSSAALVMFGWGVIFENAKKISSRNEMFARKRTLIEDISKLSESAVGFWSADMSPANKVQCLMMADIFTIKIQSLKRRINQIVKFGLNLQPDDTLKDLRKNITLNAESMYALPHEEKRDRIANIIELTDSLILHVSLTYDAKHPQS
jgi:hypothetical protein